MTNILVLSAGTRNKIIQYFKENLNKNGIKTGNVIATDMSDIAPAIYEADKHYKVPKITDPDYINIIFDICKKESITGVLTLIDPELSLLAKFEKEFKNLGVTVIGSSYDLCELSLDKYKMFTWLKNNNIKCAETFIDFKAFEKSNIAYPVFIKPRCGSASIAISKAKDEDTAKFLFEKQDNMIVQEFLNGQEIGADVYIDMLTGEVVSIFTKKKIVMRAGETDKSVSFKNQKLFNFIESFVKKAGFKGQIDIDIFEIDGEYYISEVNPRFGGGYPHAYCCNVNNMELIINNLQGKSNEKQIGNYKENVFMMKYNEIMII